MSRRESAIVGNLGGRIVASDQEVCTKLALELIAIGKTLSDNGREHVLQVLSQIDHQGEGYQAILAAMREDTKHWLYFLERFDLPEGQQALEYLNGWLIGLQVTVERNTSSANSAVATSSKPDGDEPTTPNNTFFSSARLYPRVLSTIERQLEKGKIDEYTITCVCDLFSLAGDEVAAEILTDWFLRFGLTGRSAADLLLEVLLEVIKKSPAVVYNLILDALFIVADRDCAKGELRREALMQFLERNPPCDQISIARLVAMVLNGLRQGPHTEAIPPGTAETRSSLQMPPTHLVSAWAAFAAQLLNTRAYKAAEGEGGDNVTPAERARLQLALATSTAADLTRLRDILTHSVVVSGEL